jgi:uncharacterized membrane protein YhfC
MHGIFIMAALTLALAAALWGGMLYLIAGRQTRYLWPILLGLPLSALVNLWVKRPVGVTVGQWAGIPPGQGLATPVWFIVFLFLLAPVFEEAIKVAPMLLGPVRRLAVSPLTGLWLGTALGLGFGLGEAAFLAYGISQSPQYAGLPWYLFTGYLNERLVVCFAHAGMTALVVTLLQRGLLWGFLGYLAAAALHALLNIGALLYQLNLLGPAATQLTLLASLLVIAFIYEAMRRKATRRSEQVGRSEEVVYFRRDHMGED